MRMDCKTRCVGSSSAQRSPAVSKIQQDGRTGAAPRLLLRSSVLWELISSRKAARPPIPSAVSRQVRGYAARIFSAPALKFPASSPISFASSSALSDRPGIQSHLFLFSLHRVVQFYQFYSGFTEIV